jgi:formate dehydrogenase subunit gamma
VPEPRRLPRYGRTERAVHWVHAAAFTILLGTGLCLYLPSLAEAIGRRPVLKATHLWTAVAWLVALAAVVVLGDRRALRRTLREVNRFDADDRAWFRDRRRPQGRMNAGQKLNAVATAAFAILFGVSGFLLWYGERDTRFRLPSALLVHDWLMYVSLFLFVGHLYLSLVKPSTKHALSGMTRGWVYEDWARRRHAKWAAELGREQEPDDPAGERRQDRDAGLEARVR